MPPWIWVQAHTATASDAIAAHGTALRSDAGLRDVSLIASWVRAAPRRIRVGLGSNRAPSKGDAIDMTATNHRAAQIRRELAAVVGDANCLSDSGELRAYESDALPAFRMRPDIVVLPASTDEVSAVVRIARKYGLPIVPRGAGTGLSGGALPVAGCVVVALTRMNRILTIDLFNARMRLQPGVVNLDVSRAIAPAGYYYVPDPSSQSVCSIGGNIAENSGGAHCLKYGFTSNHVVAATIVTSDGAVVPLGAAAADPIGYDLMAALVGSEGLVGIVTEAVVRLLRAPEATRTLFALFPSCDDAARCVSEIVAGGIVPAAIEMMDALAMEAIVAATAVDWPAQFDETPVGASLLIDVDGPAAEAEHTAAEAIAIARGCNALDVRTPKDAVERDLMWRGRRSAFAAVGRISSHYYVADGVIPRSHIAEVLREIGAAATRAGLRVANVFHAGDGNLHPLVLYDARVEGQSDAAQALSGEILKICLAHGGSITGEHGVGADKAAYMGEMFGEADLDAMNAVRCAFDPATAFNPGKVFPTPRLCGDAPGPYKPHAAELAGTAGRG